MLSSVTYGMATLVKHGTQHLPALRPLAIYTYHNSVRISAVLIDLRLLLPPRLPPAPPDVQAVFALAKSEEFWALLTSVLIQDLSWDTRSSYAGGGGAPGRRPLQGGGERGLDGAQTARLCSTLRCHAVVLQVWYGGGGVSCGFSERGRSDRSSSPPPAGPSSDA